MSKKKQEPSPLEAPVESLGERLKQAREKASYDRLEFGKETKISQSILKAIEEDDYNGLPADAFCRGFYTIYAKSVGLDPEEIVTKFTMERASNSPNQDNSASAPGKYAKEVSNMAQPTSVSPTSTIGYILFLLVIIGAGLCWYFGINPATYLSEKLRSMQQEKTLLDETPTEETDSQSTQLFYDSKRRFGSTFKVPSTTLSEKLIVVADVGPLSLTHPPASME